MKKTIGLLAAVVAALGITTPAQASYTTSLVVLGDSFASGTGAGDYQEGTAGNCWRSNNSYGEQVAARLREAGSLGSLANVSCSGAATTDLSVPFKDRPAQLDALKPDTDLVLLTIGTNDIGYAEYGTTCVLSDCTGAPTEAILAKLPQMGTNVTALLTEIDRRSPDARIVVVGYGRQVSTADNPPGATLDPICGEGFLTTAERVEGNRVTDGIDTTLGAAVAEAASQGVSATYASPFSRPETFEGHALCEAGTPFLRGFDALAPGQEGLEAVFHPNVQGQTALASLVGV
ncbi:GDSL-like Lipase/Acylhydrolase family protein [Lentzea xinjiangensis]|uniref:GDSL-like Lipase/Acylhydrolase family protein n=1 Tax=Lentzea xinjiangensis TaxID=402600 RepID=A0A1H9M1Y2_9PSEU|nr:SGNH/GDSL hydrolase family protein [Lentzea xinjiangensis]SER17678.1 GDSL-like Lipase/Acylhydrolase family protein [Lentzea xinjiangensis]